MNDKDLQDAAVNVFLWLYDHGVCWVGIVEQIEAQIAKTGKAPASEEDIEEFLKIWPQ
jgi:hypothetical protein